MSDINILSIEKQNLLLTCYKNESEIWRTGENISIQANKITYTTNVNNMYNSIQSIIKMNESEKLKYRQNAFEKSKADFEFFKKNFIKLL